MPGHPSWYPILLLVMAGLVVTVAALYLNYRFYLARGPFHDSQDYLNQLARVMWLAREHGIGVAIKESGTGTTVFLPWLIGALIAPIVDPARALAIFVQLPLLFLQLFTGYRYFRCYSRISVNAVVLYATILVAYPAVFHFNGGLGDFRMDLPQAYGFGSFLTAFMLARKIGNLREWAFTGTVIAALSLFRSTAPVYIVMLLGPVFLFDLLRLGSREVAKRYMALAAVAALLSGWFFIGNFSHLHYYYFVWNTDANAHLPLSESLRHVDLMAKHLGSSLTLALIFAMVVAFFQVQYSLKQWVARVNWVALMGGLMPITYLVLSGAGLNPFVSMVSIPGLVIFMLHPLDVQEGEVAGKMTRFIPGVVALGLAASLSISIARFDKNISEWIPFREGLEQLANVIVNDGKAQGTRHARIAFLYQGGVDSVTLINHFIYDKYYIFDRQRRVAKGGLTLSFQFYGFGAEEEWRKIPGDIDRDKIANVVREAMENTDYVIMANETSLLPAHHKVNRYAVDIRTMLSAESHFQPLSSSITVSPVEHVTVYKVRK